MISSLCGGTVLNPTLSVTAPPGTQFQNGTTKPVPVVFGNAFCEGVIISDIYAEAPTTIIGTYNFNLLLQYAVALWQVICCGKIKLNWIVIDSQVQLVVNTPLYNGLPYDPTRFNDGDPSAFNDEFPTLADKQTNLRGVTSLVPLPFLSPLHGVTHYYFGDEGIIPVDLSNKVPKVTYDVTRLLDTGLSINGDDIPAPPADSQVVSKYLSYHCVFLNPAASVTKISVICPTGLLHVDDKIVFAAPVSTNPLPALFSAGTVYYVKTVDNTITYPPGVVQIELSATLGGIAIDHIGYLTWNVSIQYCSLILVRNAGNNPASAIFDLLTNPFYGLGLDATIGTGNVDINVASFQAVHQFFWDTATNGKPYGVNAVFADKTTAKEMLKKICEWTDCILTLDNDGKFYLTVNDPARLATSGRMGGAAGAPPQLSTDDFQSFSPTIQTFDDTVNEFRAKFTSFADSYATLEVFFRNEANIDATGTVRSKDYDLSCFIFPDILAIRLFEIAKRESFPLMTVSAVCGIALLTSLVNDIFRLTFPEYGIDDYFKITKKTPDTLDSSRVKLEFIQCAELMFDLNSPGISEAFPTVPSTAVPGGSLVVENLTFPAGTNLSTVRAVPYVTDADSTVVWGAGQENVGTLVYDPDPGFANNGDYTIVGHNQVKLNPTTWANSIQSNVLGKLNVDSY